MNFYLWRWGLVALFAGAWIAAMFGSVSLGATVHLLAVAAVILTFVQLRTRPALSSFEVWQAKRQTVRSTRRR